MDFFSKNKKYVGLVGCLITIVGLFLPFIKVLGISANYIDGDGVIILITTIITGILIFLKKDKISLVSTGISTLVFIVTIVNIEFSMISIGIGFILVLLGLICQIAHCFLNKSES